MYQNHPYRSLQAPSEAPFELKHSPGKGWGAFTTRRIKRGTMILREKPLFVIWKSREEITEENVWKAFHKLPLTHIMTEKSFAISESSVPQSSDSPVNGLFLLQSRFNHSCLSNSKVPVIGGEIITTFATRDIAAGEELTFYYTSDFEGKTGHNHHQALRFVCDCKARLPGTHFQQVGDMRRTLVRGLQYLTLGVDLDRKRQGSTSPIIIDSILKNIAEDSAIALLARLIYNLLTMDLLEEGGLLDHFMVKRFSPGILLTTTWFETESNARTASLAIAQKNCLEKSRMAFRLYGRENAADYTISVQLRILYGLTVTP